MNENTCEFTNEKMIIIMINTSKHILSDGDIHVYFHL